MVEKKRKDILTGFMKKSSIIEEEDMGSSIKKFNSRVYMNF